MHKRGFDVGIAQAGKCLARRAAGIDGGQAFLDVVAMLLDVTRYEKLHGTPIAGTEIAAGDKMIGHRPRLVVSPRLKGSDELALVDQAILKREHAKEQVSR